MGRTLTGFSFDAGGHVYRDHRGEIPHITGMLERTGWIDSTWMTEESSERGKVVHSLTAHFDSESLDVATDVDESFRGYLLAHQKVAALLSPRWTHIEMPVVHPSYRFGGRPDRLGRVYGLKTVLEVKSGAPMKSHAIQTALQAILAASEGGLPAEHWVRMAEYLTPTGKFTIKEFTDRRDFDEAYRIIRTCCGPVLNMNAHD